MAGSSSPPPPVNPNAPQGPQKPEEPSPDAGKGFHAKPMEFLGMSFTAEESTQLWQSVIQLVNREIERDKARSIKAIRNFGKDEEDKQ